MRVLKGKVNSSMDDNRSNMLTFLALAILILFVVWLT